LNAGVWEVREAALSRDEEKHDLIHRLRSLEKTDAAVDLNIKAAFELILALAPASAEASRFGLNPQLPIDHLGLGHAEILQLFIAPGHGGKVIKIISELVKGIAILGQLSR